MDEIEQKNQFQQWLPLYVNGVLGEVECNWMKEYIVNHPSASADVQVERLLKSALLEELPDFTPDTGLAGFMERLQAEQRQSRTLKDCFTDFVNRLVAEPLWSFAVLALLIQSSVIVALLYQQPEVIPTDSAEWRSPAVVQQQNGPFLRITFKPHATEEQIRLLLVKIRGSFVSGPGQLGNYIVKVHGNALEEAQSQALKSDFVESVQVIQALPHD